MKKLICVILLVACLVSVLTACGSLTCGLCGEWIFGGGHKTYNPYLMEKRTIYVCDDCYSEHFGE